MHERIQLSETTSRSNRMVGWNVKAEAKLQVQIDKTTNGGCLFWSQNGKSVLADRCIYK